MKKIKLINCLILVCIIIFSCNSDPKSAVNANVSFEAEQLLKFLKEIKGHYILSGQHDFINGGTRYTDSVKVITGKYPVVWGSDFSWGYEGDHPEKYQHCGPYNIATPFDSTMFLDLSIDELRQNLVKTIKEKHSQGHIITLMWHHCFPDEGVDCPGENIWAMENRPAPETMKELLTEGTELNVKWKTEMDGIAFYLKQLQDANIPVLWRPYHEMNGVWFWWCNQRGEYGFKELWIGMYEYFTDYHKLNNLLWVWNTNAPRDIEGDEAFDYELFYPGDEYVDVLATDVYRADYKQSHHDDLLKLAKEKPIALGEIGTLPSSSKIDEQPEWNWFMCWGYFISGIRKNTSQMVKDVYNNPRVLTLDEVKLENGEYNIIVVE